MTTKELSIQETALGLSLSRNLVGRDVEGNRYYLDVEIKGTAQSSQGVNHETIEQGAPVISMSGYIVSKGCRSWHSGGQNIDRFDSIIKYANRWSAAELGDVLAIWAAYHLNDMFSHCAHQDSDIDWDKVEPCSVTGYKAGSAWLYAPIPNHVLITLTGLIIKHRSDGSK